MKNKILSERIYGHSDYDKVFEELKAEGYSTGSEEQYDKLIDEAGRRLFPEKKRYVCGFCFNIDLTEVVLIRRNKPKWQAGFLNGVGGKIEPDETGQDAMIREFKEEAGLDTMLWYRLANLSGKDWEVEFFYYIEDKRFEEIKTQTDEQIEICDTENLVNYKTIYNLQWLIPLAINKKFGIDYKIFIES